MKIRRHRSERDAREKDNYHYSGMESELITVPIFFSQFYRSGIKWSSLLAFSGVAACQSGSLSDWIPVSSGRDKARRKQRSRVTSRFLVIGGGAKLRALDGWSTTIAGKRGTKRGKEHTVRFGDKKLLKERSGYRTR